MDDMKLVEAAARARLFSYSPYSGFAVGAAVLTGSGKVYSGCNIENGTYSLTNCAERIAIFNAVSSGERVIEALAVLADSPQPVPPCGACRQVLAEFAVPRVISANLAGELRVWTAAELLPGAFSSHDMAQKGSTLSK